jgi:hypothetical protein
MQTQSKFFDDLAKMASGALSAASGLREEVNQLIQQQFDRFMASRDLVSREEFAAVEAMASKARQEQEKLAKQVAELEKKLAETSKAPKAAAKPATRKPAARAKNASASRRTTTTRRTKTKSGDDTPGKKS